MGTINELEKQAKRDTKQALAMADFFQDFVNDMVKRGGV